MINVGMAVRLAWHAANEWLWDAHALLMVIGGVAFIVVDMPIAAGVWLFWAGAVNERRRIASGPHLVHDVDGLW